MATPLTLKCEIDAKDLTHFQFSLKNFMKHEKVTALP